MSFALCHAVLPGNMTIKAMSGTRRYTCYYMLLGCNVFAHVAHPEVKHSQGLNHVNQVMNEANAVFHRTGTKCIRGPLCNMACTLYVTFWAETCALQASQHPSRPDQSQRSKTQPALIQCNLMQ